MKFYNRKEEIAALKKAFQKSPSLSIVRGRRRVGKTTLLLKALEETGGIYLYVDPKKAEKALLAEFEEVLKKELNLQDYIRVESWKIFYDIIFSHKKHVVIDEFQRLYDASPSAIYQLQDYWDRKGSKSEISLVLSGSNVGMMKKIFIEQKAPLFKRATYDFFLKPLSFADCRQMAGDIGITNIEEQIRLYAIFGGIPYYYALLGKEKVENWKDAVKTLLLNQFSPLKTEVRDTMVESFGKNHASYYAVINAIALGKATKKEISDFAGIRETSIYPYLYDLEELVDIIQYEVPITEKKEWKTRRGRFVLNDNFFRFWFRFIFRNMSYYEEGNYGYLLGRISGEFESYVGAAFEQVARGFMVKMNESGKLPANFPKIGRWWNRKGDEIDLVLLSEEEDAIMLVECKWAKDVQAGTVLNSLKEKEKLMEHRKKNIYYASIARGFSSKCEGIICFDINDLDRLLR